jgi:hypothetical protein
MAKFGEGVRNGRMRKPRAVTVLLVLSGSIAVLAAGLTGCGSTSAHVSPNRLISHSRGIGPISVGETRAKIDAAYGTGRRAFLPGRPHDTPITFYPAVSIGVLYYGNHALYVETTAPRYRTTSGLGVGSTAAQLKKSGADSQNGGELWGLINGKLATTFFMTNSFLPAHSWAVRVVVGPLGD